MHSKYGINANTMLYNIKIAILTSKSNGMKKFLSLFAAILFAGTLMAGDFHLEKVTSVEKGKTYAFVRNGKALTTTSNSALQTEDVNLGTIDGTQAFLWKLVLEEDSFKLSNISKGEDKFLRNTSSTSLSIVATEGRNRWVITFDGDVALIATSERFIAETMKDGQPTNTYKAYGFGKDNKGLEDYPGHDFTVYELKEGASVTPSLLADNLDLQSVMSRTLPLVTDTNIIVTASNLTAEIAVSVKGSNISVPDKLPKEGGKLDIHINAPNEGKFSDTIVLTSGALKKEVAIEANVVKSVGEGTEENPFTLEDVAKFDNGYAGKYWVKGFILGYFKKGGLIENDPEAIDSTRLALGTTKDQTDKLIPVSLTKSTKGEQKVREELNIKANPGVIGYEVILYGKMEKYMDTTGIKSVSDYKWAGEVPEAKKSKDATIKSLKINDESVTEDNGIFAYEAPADLEKKEVEVAFELNDAKAKADKDNPFKVAVPESDEAPATEVKLTVTAEDGVTTAEYTIKVTRAKAEPIDLGQEAVDNAVVGTKAVKTFENGQLVIIKNGVKYNAQGAIMK